MELAAQQIGKEHHVRPELVDHHMADRAEPRSQARATMRPSAEQPELDVAVLVTLTGANEP